MKLPVTPEMISEAQQRLIDLGYWIEEADGKWGEASRHGLIAFQKVERRKRTGKLTPDELQALRTAARPAPRERGFLHVEVDLQRQVLFMVDAEGTVSKILPVSTGNGKLFTIEGETERAVTPLGRFRVYRKLEGWRKSPLGLLYYPSYIVGGIAIHGNPSVPAQPASHGCIRIPMFAAEEFSLLTPIGTQVIVYDGSAPPPQSVSPPR
jgi:N-acetylmuramoyl-L-alanine amidase